MHDFQDNIIDNAATITANANTAAFVRPERQGVHGVVFLAHLGADPTGTTPTLTFTLQSSMDGTTWHDVKASSALNANGQNCRLDANGIEPYWRVEKVIGGTATPTFTLVTSHLVFLQ